jgi:hypothetical protein
LTFKGKRGGHSFFSPEAIFAKLAPFEFTMSALTINGAQAGQQFRSKLRINRDAASAKFTVPEHFNRQGANPLVDGIMRRGCSWIASPLV